MWIQWHPSSSLLVESALAQNYCVNRVCVQLKVNEAIIRLSWSKDSDNGLLSSASIICLSDCISAQSFLHYYSIEARSHLHTTIKKYISTSVLCLLLKKGARGGASNNNQVICWKSRCQFVLTLWRKSIDVRHWDLKLRLNQRGC